MSAIASSKRYSYPVKMSTLDRLQNKEGFIYLSPTVPTLPLGLFNDPSLETIIQDKSGLRVLFQNILGWSHWKDIKKEATKALDAHNGSLAQKSYPGQTHSGGKVLHYSSSSYPFRLFSKSLFRKYVHVSMMTTVRKC